VAVDRLRYSSGEKLDIIALDALSVNTSPYTSPFEIETVECSIKLLEFYFKRYNDAKCTNDVKYHVERHDESDECPNNEYSHELDDCDEYRREFNDCHDYCSKFNKCPDKFDHCPDRFDESFDFNRS